MPEAKAKGILVGVDGSVESDAAVRWATREAMMRGAPITLVHVVAPVPDWPTSARQTQIAEWREENARAVITQACKVVSAAVGDAESPEVSTEALHSNVVAALIAASEHAEMMVTGSRGVDAAGRFLLGSVSSGLVRHAYCPVAVIHGDDGSADSAAPVVVGIDGSPVSEAATELAFDEASRRGVDLVALHAWSDAGIFPVLGADWREFEAHASEALTEGLAGWQERYPDVHVQRRLVCDQPARWLIQESEHAQLVVVGSHGRGGFAGMLLGSVSSALAQSAKAPLIVVRAKVAAPSNRP